MGVLTVKVVKASHLADKDLMGKTDPYVKLGTLYRFVLFCSVPFRSSMVVTLLRCDATGEEELNYITNQCRAFISVLPFVFVMFLSRT